jgi:hypothetical protein
VRLERYLKKRVFDHIWLQGLDIHEESDYEEKDELGFFYLGRGSRFYSLGKGNGRYCNK